MFSEDVATNTSLIFESKVYNKIIVYYAAVLCNVIEELAF